MDMVVSTLHFIQPETRAGTRHEQSCAHLLAHLLDVRVDHIITIGISRDEADLLLVVSLVLQALNSISTKVLITTSTGAEFSFR